MTAKQAVEALMRKDPKSATLKFLRNEGLLNDILYPEGPYAARQQRATNGSMGGVGIRGNSNSNSGGGGGCSSATREDRAGREGGRRIRSISSTATTSTHSSSAGSKRSGSDTVNSKDDPLLAFLAEFKSDEDRSSVGSEESDTKTRSLSALDDLDRSVIVNFMHTFQLSHIVRF